MTTGGNGVVRGDRSLTRMAWQRAPASRSCRSCTPGRCSSGGPGGSSGTPQCRRPAGSSWARRNWAPPLAPWASSPSKRSATPGTPLFLAAKSTLSPRPPLATGSAGSAFVREGPQKGGVRCPSRASALRFLAAHSCVPMHTEKKKKKKKKKQYRERKRDKKDKLTSLRFCFRRRSAAAWDAEAPASLRRRGTSFSSPGDGSSSKITTTGSLVDAIGSVPLTRAPRLGRERHCEAHLKKKKRERFPAGKVYVRKCCRPSKLFCFFFFSLRRRRKTEKT